MAIVFFAVAGDVIWLTPKGAQGKRTAGIGVYFSNHDGGTTQKKIENYLAGALGGGGCRGLPPRPLAGLAGAPMAVAERSGCSWLMPRVLEPPSGLLSPGLRPPLDDGRKRCRASWPARPGCPTW